MKVVTWIAPAYGVIVAFHAANRAACATAEDREHASVAIREIRGAFYDLSEEWKAAARDYTAPDFELNLTLFMQRAPTSLRFDTQTWDWLKKQIAGLPEQGCTVGARGVVEQSIKDAVVGDLA